MNKLSVFLVFTLFFCSNRKEKPLLDNNNFIEVNFLQKGIKFPISNPCGLIVSDGNRKDRHHKIIKEVEIIKKFNEYFSELTVDKIQGTLDSRIRIIYTHNKEKDTICMGEFSEIAVNGVKMDNHDEFHQFVKTIIEYETTIRHPLTGKMIPKEEIKKK